MTTTANTGPDAATQDPTSSAVPSVVVRDLHQHYGDFEAVRGVSFEIRPGELFALLGTNGAGKTTTIETLEGFRRPSSGTVRVFGQDPFGQPAGVRERVDAVLQGSGLMDDLSVDECLGLTSDLAAAPRDVDEILRWYAAEMPRPIHGWTPIAGEEGSPVLSFRKGAERCLVTARTEGAAVRVVVERNTGGAGRTDEATAPGPER